MFQSEFLLVPCKQLTVWYFQYFSVLIHKNTANYVYVLSFKCIMESNTVSVSYTSLSHSHNLLHFCGQIITEFHTDL